MNHDSSDTTFDSAMNRDSYDTTFDSSDDSESSGATYVVHAMTHELSGPSCGFSDDP